MSNYTTLPDNDSGNYNPGSQGVYAQFPLATPKYMRMRRPVDAEFKDTSARMFLSLADASPDARQRYLRALPPDPAVQKLARVLTGDAASPSGGTGFIDFVLQQADEPLSEKFQVSETLGNGFVVYMFGSAPETWTYSGTLLNTFQDDQRVGMFLAYEELMRGTRCAERGSLFRLRYDGFVVSGTILSFRQGIRAENEMASSFVVQVLVKQVIVIFEPRVSDVIVDDAFSAGLTLPDLSAGSDVRVRATMFASPGASGRSAAGAAPNAPTASPLAQSATPAATEPEVRGGGGQVQNPARAGSL